MTDSPELHIYSPSWWHEDALIVGTESGLRHLIDVLNRALAAGVGAGITMANDGEGYAVIAVKAEPSAFAKLKAHYTDETAAHCGRGDEPWDLVLGDGSKEERMEVYAQLMAGAVGSRMGRA